MNNNLTTAMKLGATLQDFRILKGLTQKQVGDLIGVSGSAIGTYENGTREPSLDMLIFFSQLYNVSVDYLLGLTKYETVHRYDPEIIQTEVGMLPITEYVNGLYQLDAHKRTIVYEVLEGELLKLSKRNEE